MTKKKRGHPDAEEILARPWCYYCERDFDDLKILISHQKARHFKCDRCGRRLNTAGGLSVHMNQVHKETLAAVDNALPNRADLSVEIFGMEGIPEDIIQQHNQRVLLQFHQNEADRRVASGNAGPGGSGGGAGVKKPKMEDASDLKKRLAEHKAKKAQEAAGGGSGSGTPAGAANGMQSPSLSQSPNPYVSLINVGHLSSPYQSQQQQQQQHQHQQQQQQQLGSPPYGQLPQQYHGSLPQPPFLQPFGQPSYQIIPQHHPFAQQPPFTQAPPGFGAQAQQFPSGIAQYTSQQFPQSGGAPFPPLQQQFGYGSPLPMPFQQNRIPQSASPFQDSATVRLPPPPGLPQRPSFGAPPVSNFQLQQMHQGHVPGAPVPSQQAGFAVSQDPRIRNGATGPSHPNHTNSENMQEEPSATAAEVDELVANAAKDSETATAAKLAPMPAETTEKKSKKEKDKDKATKLVYSDNEISPEEKMAKMSRYTFNPAKRKEENVLGGAVEAPVTGAVA